MTLEAFQQKIAYYKKAIISTLTIVVAVLAYAITHNYLPTGWAAGASAVLGLLGEILHVLKPNASSPDVPELVQGPQVPETDQDPDEDWLPAEKVTTSHVVNENNNEEIS